MPSATETLAAWGVTPVGVTRFCGRPDLPAMGGTKDPDLDAVRVAAPELVVLCEEENRHEDAEALVAAGLAIHVVRIDSVADVATELTSLAAALGLDVPPGLDGPPFASPPRHSSADTPVAPVTGDESSAAPRSARVRAEVVAFVPIWRRPWMTISGGCYGASLLDSIGIGTAFADASPRYPEVTLDEAAARRPDVVLAPSEPYPFRERHVAELQEVAPVVLVDGQDLFWWGVRTPDAQRRLRAALADVPRRR